MLPGLLVDLRSDTVTRPTPGMRRAMAEAIVGDDVFGDDPTVQVLEHRVAELAGKEAALFVPSGTMGNLIAVKCHTEPSDAVLLEDRSHIFLNEQGGVAALAGCLAHPVPSDRGAIAVETLEAARRGENDHVAKLSLVCMENTHNWHGGTVVPFAAMQALSMQARARGIRVHLDGARLWNASAASGREIREWAALADTVMMCFSKALGAPIGSILVGDGELVRRARRVRKRWGGGMRQVGVLAAAALHALDHHVGRLSDDHARARALATALRRVPGVSVIAPETNIVMIEIEHPALDPAGLSAALRGRGVLIDPSGRRRLRAMTHLDVDDEGLERAASAFRSVVEEQIGRSARP